MTDKSKFSVLGAHHREVYDFDATTWAKYDHTGTLVEARPVRYHNGDIYVGGDTVSAMRVVATMYEHYLNSMIVGIHPGE